MRIAPFLKRRLQFARTFPSAGVEYGPQNRVRVSTVLDSQGFTENIVVSKLRDDPETAGDGQVVTQSASTGIPASCLFRFESPRIPVSGPQRFRAKVKCTQSGGKVTAELWQNNVSLRSLGTKTISAVNTFEVLTWDWNSSEVTDPSRVQLRLIFDTSLGGGVYEIDAVDWLLNTGQTQSQTVGRFPPDVVYVTTYWPEFDINKIKEDASLGDGQFTRVSASLQNGFAQVRFGFVDPDRQISGTQRFRIRARCTTSGGSLRPYLYELGALKREFPTVNLTTDWQTFHFDWNSSEISNPNNVEMKIIVFNNQNGGEYQIDAVDWLANVAQSGAPAWPQGWGSMPALKSHFGPGLLLPDSSYGQQKWNEWINFFNGRVPDIVAGLGLASTATWDDIAGGAGTSDTTFSGQLAYYPSYFNTQIWPANKPVVLYLVGVPYSHRNVWQEGGATRWRDPSIWSNIKNGEFDVYYRRLFRRLATRCGQTGRDPNTLVIRWCGENTAWWKPDSIGPDKQSFIDGFRRTVDIMRQEVGNVLGQGKRFLIEFGPTFHMTFGQGPAVERMWNVYPGDDWVDVVGMGIHDHKGMRVQQDWDAMLVKNNYLGDWVEGYRDWYDFGASRNKWLGTSEICSNVNTYPPTNPIHPRTESNTVFWTNGFEVLRRRYDGRFLYFCYMFVGGDRNRTDALVTQPWQPDGWGEPIRLLYKL